MHPDSTTTRASVLQVYSAVVLILGIVLLAAASSRSWIYLEHDDDSTYELSLELGPRGALACHGADCETSIWNNMDEFLEQRGFEALSQKPHFALAAVAWGVFAGGVVCGIWMIALGVFGLRGHLDGFRSAKLSWIVLGVGVLAFVFLFLVWEKARLGPAAGLTLLASFLSWRILRDALAAAPRFGLPQG